MSPSNGRDVKNNWKIMYEVNAKANNIIKVVPTMNLDNAFKTKATGTAYFFRGFAMLWLSPYYGDNGPNGGIPIILDTTEPAAMDSPRPASVLQNYDQIISDLREAGKRLPLFSQLAPEEYGMPHKAAAWAFAARAASMPHSSTPNTTTRSSKCDKVMGLTGADKRELVRRRHGQGLRQPLAQAAEFRLRIYLLAAGQCGRRPEIPRHVLPERRLGPVQPLGLFPAHPFPVERIRIGRHPPRRDDHLPRADDPLHGPGHRIRQQLLFDLLGYRHVVPQIPLPVGKRPTAKARR